MESLSLIILFTLLMVTKLYLGLRNEKKIETQSVTSRTQTLRALQYYQLKVNDRMVLRTPKASKQRQLEEK